MTTPARGYSWAPFEKDHTLSLRHGAWSPRMVDPRARELVESVVSGVTWWKDCDGPAIWAWARTEARCQLIAEWLAERGDLDAMDIPGYGPVLNPLWDLRGSESDYLGHVALAGKRVLEIGPATGYLSFYMESQGAEVVSVELSPDVSWDVVPDPETDLESWSQARRAGMEGLRNSYWFAHERFESGAKVHYGDVYRLPNELGHFDLAVMGSVLLHVRDPLGVVQGCARLADALVITEPLHPDLPSDRPAMEWFAPRGEPTPDIWWRFSPEIIRRFVEAVGRTSHRTSPLVTTAIVDGSPVPAPMFTVVAWRPEAESPLTS
jgi:O-methyltransferase